MVAIAVVVVDGGSGIEPTAPMAALLTVAVVDGSGDNGVFTTTSYEDNCNPCPHCPCPHPPLEKDWMTGLKAHRDVSHLLLPCKSMVACSSCLGVHGACGYHNE